MVQGVFVFLMYYIIYMYGSGCVDISNVLYNIYICMVQGVFVFLMCYIIDKYGSGCVCISNVLYNRSVWFRVCLYF